MLPSLLGYAAGAGVRVRWAVIDGDGAFFRITKRIHNFLHATEGDGGDLGPHERRIYERRIAAEVDPIASRIHRRDVVVVHDPQPAGMIPVLKRAGARVVWRSHVGADRPNELSHRAWEFLRPYIAEADAIVFSRREYAWDDLEAGRVWVIPPSIDAFSPKNQAMPDATAASILRSAGIVPSRNGDAPVFRRSDGTTGIVSDAARMIETAPVLPDAPLVVQVSRWDRLKDPAGVLTGFAEEASEQTEAHLILAGPDPQAVTDDPEQSQVLDECIRLWTRSATARRSRIHLACLPMLDLEANAATVNALQRRADVVVQKSLAEGFGLTVAEAMWKARPVIASRVGGIQDQIEHQRSGVLIDPANLPAFGRALVSVLEDDDSVISMGVEAHRRVRAEYLAPRHLLRFGKLLRHVLGDGGETADS